MARDPQPWVDRCVARGGLMAQLPRLLFRERYRSWDVALRQPVIVNQMAALPVRRRCDLCGLVWHYASSVGVLFCERRGDRAFKFADCAGDRLVGRGGMVFHHYGL